MNLHALLFPRQEQYLIAFESLLEMVRFERPTLQEKAKGLKQMDGESWSMGELVERTCIYADAIEMKKG